ncbi:MAG TPA: DUF1697 domain-containing protein [Gaiellaceae bacterium]|jgi:uncharacterized protein (DUF1697 family)|nr:DUF1697 domain-containing protein [Gaiellaceae bacterium]
MPRDKGAGSSRKRYVALLRGINLGGHNKVSMPDLRALFASLGAEDVETYVQSGNVIFKSAEGAGKLTEAIEKSIRRDFGLSVTVLLRTRPQLAKVHAGNPFAKSRKESTRLHVTFLAEKPDAARVRELDPERAKPDEFKVVGQEIYLHCPNGYGRSKLTNAYFEKQLGVAATTRNWKTVTKLAELVSA